MTPYLVITEPNTPVAVPDLPAHQVALLLRGLEAHQQVREQMAERGIISADGMQELAPGVASARRALTAALDLWAGTTGLTVPEDGGALTARWPVDAPLVTLGVLPLAAVWELCLATDWIFLEERIAATGDPTRWAPLVAAQKTILGALAAAGVDDE